MKPRAAFQMIEMGTLRGSPNPPATLRSRQSRLAPHAIVLAAAGLFLFSASPAQAKKKSITAPAAATSEAAAADGEQTKVKIERGAGGKKVYKIEGEIVIEGKIQKPEAFYVLQKSSINYDWHELKQEFVPKILDSVTKSPF